MRTVLSTFLILAVISLVATAQAAENGLLSGKYTLHAYTLSNGAPIDSQENLYVFSKAMGSAFNKDESFAQHTIEGINGERFQGITLRAAYAPTSTITFHSSIGLTDTSTDERLDYTDRIGWELDLGMAYKFLDNFAYEVHFGYMDTGQLFTESNKYADIENITIVTNKLTMSF